MEANVYVCSTCGKSVTTTSCEHCGGTAVARQLESVAAGGEHEGLDLFGTPKDTTASAPAQPPPEALDLFGTPSPAASSPSQAPTQPTAAPAPPMSIAPESTEDPLASDLFRRTPDVSEPFHFDGEGKGLFRLYLKNVVLTMLTFGIYRFWAKVAEQKFRFQHTSFHGGRFDYHATGRERFVGFVKGLLVLLPLALSMAVLYTFVEPSMGAEDAQTLCIVGFFVVLAALKPLMAVGSLAYNLSRTSWNQMRFRFVGRAGELYGIQLTGMFLTILTLGLYLPWHECNLRRYRTENTEFGGQRFKYTGQGGDLILTLAFGQILAFLTLGLYVPWLLAFKHRFHVQHTSFQGVRFHSDVTGGQLFGTFVGGALLTVCTLGLALPWVTARYIKVLTDATSYRGTLDLEALEGAYDAQASALADGIGDAGDALSGVVEMLG